MSTARSEMTEAAAPPLTPSRCPAHGTGPAPPASRLLRLADATTLRAGLDPGDHCGPPGRKHRQATPAPRSARDTHKARTPRKITTTEVSTVRGDCQGPTGSGYVLHQRSRVSGLGKTTRQRYVTGTPPRAYPWADGESRHRQITTTSQLRLTQVEPAIHRHWTGKS